jgi:hypothetical protein
MRSRAGAFTHHEFEQPREHSHHAKSEQSHFSAY